MIARLIMYKAQSCDEAVETLMMTTYMLSS